MKFGERLKDLRNEKGLTQKQLGQIFNVDLTSIRNWEAGKNETDFAMLVRIADFFEVTLDYLLGRDEIINSFPK